MKLNSTTEMLPVTWPEFGGIHPFAPRAQWAGYQTLFENLENWLSEITGFDAVSLQPNAGSQGEYAGFSSFAHTIRIGEKPIAMSVSFRPLLTEPIQPVR